MPNRPAFTLIEVMVTIAIIGILASVAVVQFGSARQTARNSFAKTTVSDAGKSIEAFRNQERAGGRVISVGSSTASYVNNDSNMNCSGIAAIQGTIAGKGYVSGNQKFDDIRPYFSGTEIINSNDATRDSYGFNISKSLNNDYSFYYGASPISATGQTCSPSGISDRQKKLVSLEGTFLSGTVLLQQCYIIQSDYHDSSAAGVNFVAVINGHYYEKSGPFGAGMSCSTPPH